MGEQSNFLGREKKEAHAGREKKVSCWSPLPGPPPQGEGAPTSMLAKVVIFWGKIFGFE